MTRLGSNQNVFKSFGLVNDVSDLSFVNNTETHVLCCFEVHNLFHICFQCLGYKVVITLVVGSRICLPVILRQIEIARQLSFFLWGNLLRKLRISVTDFIQLLSGGLYTTASKKRLIKIYSQKHKRVLDQGWHVI